MLEEVLANLAARPRLVKYDGRDYLVAPMSMLVPGVLNGSKGPLLYPEEEVTKDPGAWNGMPIVVYHPEVGGKHVSARDPDVLERSQVGTVYRTTTQNGKLDAEGWFDVEKVRAADSRLAREKRDYKPILPRLMKGKPVELSTGLFTDNDPVENDGNNVHNGKTYSFVARNYKPDHLAVLPDQTGACSLKDGCGVMVNRKGHKVPSHLRGLRDALDQVLNAFCPTGEGGGRDNSCGKGGIGSTLKPTWKVTPPSLIKKNSQVTVMTGAADEVGRAGLVKSVKKGMVDVVLFASMEHGFQKETKVPYDFIRVDNQTTTNSSEGHDMTRKQVIKYLTTNCDCWKGGEKTLESMDGKQLLKLKNNAERQAKLTIVVNSAAEALGYDGVDDTVLNEMPAKMKGICDPDEDETPTPKKGKKPVKNASADADDEWFNSLPPRARSAVANAIRFENKAKQAVIDRLVANAEEGDDKKVVLGVLKSLDLDDLESFGRVFGRRQGRPTMNRRPLFLDEGDEDGDEELEPDYGGAAGVTSNKAGGGGKDDGEDEGLPLPTMNWAQMKDDMDKQLAKGRRKAVAAS